MLNIAIFDDQPFVVDSIVASFKSKPKVNFVFGAHNMESLIDCLNTYQIDFVISDVLTDEDIGLSVFEKIAEDFPEIKVIAFSSITSDFVIKCLKELGVVAFVNKKESLDFLYEAMMDEVFKSKNVILSKKIPALTNKEKRIAYQLSQGSTAQEIADITGSSVNTVNNQKNELIKKYKCANTTELIVKLSQLGLITLQ